MYPPYYPQSTSLPSPYAYYSPYSYTPAAHGHYSNTPATPARASISDFQNVFQVNYAAQEPPASPAFRIALSDSTGTVLNHATPQNPPSKSGTSKRKQPLTAQSISSKRQNTSSARASACPAASSTAVPPSGYQPITGPAVPGAGPQLAAVSDPLGPPERLVRSRGPCSSLGSLIDTPTTTHSSSSDVHYFVRGLKTNERPSVAPANEKRSGECPSKKEYDYLGCILCPYVTLFYL